MPLPIAQTGGDSHALAKRFELLERRLRLVEQQAVQPATASGDFVAHEGETIFVSAPTTGAVGLLPTAKSANRGATITLVCQTTNPVTLRTVSGTVNGQLSITRQRVGTYQLVSDGASGWWAPSLDLPRPRDAAIQDWFCSGNVTSGQIGSLGWNLTGVGTPACTRNATGMAAPTKLTLTTTAAANDRTTLCLAQTEAGNVVKPSECAVIQTVQSFNAVTATKRLFFGLATTLATAPASAANSLGFLYDSSVGANWLTIARFGTTGTATDTGVAASSADALLTIWQQSPMTFRFYIGQVLVGTIAGTLAVSALPMNAGFRLETLTTSATTHRVGYFGMTCLGLGSPYYGDEFLKA
jgi:hypothetical protein